ncbi:Hypothetical predicted protein [Cloeon dipterum]|uniref:BTB domain-containing protein n=1 Tax=Cloeon dipterum TaxID=197152 RepID=A0A8S1CRJ7_9INSE|nr:Hypothetical predicted protein [Cloeon dipterum]
MATNLYKFVLGKSHQQCKVKVGCGNITELRGCSKEILKKACPTLCHVIENYDINNSVPIRIHGSPAAFDAAMRFLLDPQNLHLDEFRAVELLDFAWKYESPELLKAAESLCLQLNFADLHTISLINYHSSFLTCKLWTGKEDRENELLEEISRRGAEVLNYLSASKKMCFDTVKKILEQQRLNVFKEKDVFDCIKEWRNNIINAVEENEYDNYEFVKIEQRWKKELLPLIRFEFFSINDVNNILDENSSPLSITEKIALLQKIDSRNIGLDKNFQLPMLTLSGEEFSPGGGLNLEFWSKWRGNFIPFTERVMLLKPEDEKQKIYDADEQTLNIQPLKMDLYLLSVRLNNLQGLHHNPEIMQLSLSVAVIREEDEKTESESYYVMEKGDDYFYLSWLNGDQKLFMAQKSSVTSLARRSGFTRSAAMVACTVRRESFKRKIKMAWKRSNKLLFFSYQLITPVIGESTIRWHNLTR